MYRYIFMLGHYLAEPTTEWHGITSRFYREQIRQMHPEMEEIRVSDVHPACYHFPFDIEEKASYHAIFQGDPFQLMIGHIFVETDKSIYDPLFTIDAINDLIADTKSIIIYAEASTDSLRTYHNCFEFYEDETEGAMKKILDMFRTCMVDFEGKKSLDECTPLRQ